MDLKNIGFYTLNDERVKNASVDSQLMRCELILTDVCNFKCPYCRGLRDDVKGTKTLEEAKYIVDLWTKDNLKNIRLSGGEPTTWKPLLELVRYIKNKGVERIAISTNGSADFSYYKELIDAGVNDFSISLDACCSSFGDAMAGGIPGIWQKVIDNIREISKISYVTVGVVVTEETLNELNKVISYADGLGVSDIRIISAAQFNKILEVAQQMDQKIIDKYPILKYRINNIKNGRNVRGIKELDSRKCGLVLDDMAIAGDYHFPCIIYMREGGNPIGKIGENMRQERLEWMNKHDSHKDSICSKNCLDVCIDYNNKYMNYKAIKTKLPKMNSSQFTWNIWRSGSIHELAIPCRFSTITSDKGRSVIQEYAVGWCDGESLNCRPKENHKAVMFFKDGEHFWFHMRTNEFIEVFC